MRFYVLYEQGPREYMEDRHVAQQVGVGGHVAAVFDGHAGDELSEHCATAFPEHLTRALSAAPGHPAIALREAVRSVEDAARKDMPDARAGCTLCAVLVTPAAFITANVGDSRAILCRANEIVDLSRDHKPSDALEQERILSGGGFVTQPHQTDGVHRVMGRLSLSRALGDWELKPWVSSEPDVTVHERADGDRFVVIASDGVWDVMTSREVAHLLTRAFEQGMRPKAALHKLLAESRRRGSGDNITAMLVDVARRPLSRGVL